MWSQSTAHVALLEYMFRISNVRPCISLTSPLDAWKYGTLGRSQGQNFFKELLSF